MMGSSLVIFMMLDCRLELLSKSITAFAADDAGLISRDLSSTLGFLK
jgi:hypothetical protein